MTQSLQQDVRYIPGVGPKLCEILKMMGIATIQDLLEWYPRAYIDANSPQPVRSIRFGETAVIKVTIDKIDTRRSQKRGMAMLDAHCHDQEGGELLARWFHQPYLKEKLLPGSQWILIGALQRFQGETVMMSPTIESQPRVISIYRQSKSVTGKMLSRYIAWVLDRYAAEIKDEIPLELLQERGLVGLHEALTGIHRPNNLTEVGVAREYLAFAEVFRFFLRMRLGRNEKIKEKGIVVPYQIEFLKELAAALPFQLTNDQKKAIWESVREMALGRPMLRLLNGDVGSGKTVVAAIMAAVVAKEGYQTAILVPTDVLATQHAGSIAKLLASFNVEVAMWTAARKDNLEAPIIVGTHALLQEDIRIPRLALVVVDEQHRFGVRQRAHLRDQKDRSPHLLSMTATPIPRTLALVLYGDLSVSTLKEKPLGRLPVITELLNPQDRNKLHERIKSEIKAGFQVIVICPLIKKEEVDVGDIAPTLFDPEALWREEKKTVEKEAARLRNDHPEYGRIEILHGKMKAKEKQAVLEQMHSGDINLLVATSVVEVGMDIAGATVIVIEGAESFGLAQLHQFRGRVGRNSYQSYCFLASTFLNDNIQRRLQVVVDNDSGFSVAEQDLALRGPGEFSGVAQSGLPDFKMASLANLEYLREVKDVVEEYCRKNPNYEKSYSENDYSNIGQRLE